MKEFVVGVLAIVGFCLLGVAWYLFCRHQFPDPQIGVPIFLLTPVVTAFVLSFASAIGSFILNKVGK